MDNTTIRDLALQQSAYDCNCSPEDFRAEENRVFESTVSDKARRYLKLPHICNLVSYGTNIVAVGKKDLLPEISRFINCIPSIEDCFETPGIYPLNRILEKEGAKICFMADYFLPDIDAVFRFSASCPYELRILTPEDFAELYVPQWKNALCEDRKHLDMVAVGAYDNGNLIGLAGASADCDTMWQIGVDVLPFYRRKGVGAVLTNRLAREIFNRDKVPFYCAAWSNVKSVKNAIGSGFRPGWVEATAKSDTFIEDMIKHPSVDMGIHPSGTEF